MNKLQNLSLRVGIAVTGALLPLSRVLAETPFQRAQNDLTKIADTSQVKTTSLPVLVGSIINVILGVLGIVLLFYVLYAGFLWMTAGGDTKKVEEAKTMLRNAIIGLVLIMASVAISNFVIQQLTTVANAS